jgi:hypothetical protein
MFYRSDQSTISCIENVKYAEINFKEKFSENSCFSVGFTTLKDFSTLFYQDWMLGWSSDSIGYHSDDGLICRDGSAVVRKKEKFSHNDIIGFGVNLENNHIFFTKNGILIFNQPYSFFWNTTIFPAIVMDSPILYQINHGEEEFKFMNFYETLYTQN